MANALRDLAEWLDQAGPVKSRERYARLYGSEHPCTMRIGFHLYPIDFCSRELFLDSLQFTLNETGGRGGRTVQPDRLPSLLRDLVRIEDVETVDWLKDRLLCRAMGEMVQTLPFHDNPWLPVIREVGTQLQSMPRDNASPRFQSEERS